MDKIGLESARSAIAHTEAEALEGLSRRDGFLCDCLNDRSSPVADRRGVDAVINLGDSLSGPLLPLETAQFLMAQDWEHLAGNHERQVLTQGPGTWCAEDAFTHSQLGAKELAWIASLRPVQRYSAEVFLCHATPERDVGDLLDTVQVPGRAGVAANQIGVGLAVFSYNIDGDLGYVINPQLVEVRRARPS